MSPSAPEEPHRMPVPEYRIEELAHRSGTTVRTIRAYQDRGLLPKPVRRGRANVYDDTHLARLRQTAELLDRGYTLASIKELLEAWDTGRGLGGVLGLVAEVEGPWTDEEPGRIGPAELDGLFGRGAPADGTGSGEGDDTEGRTARDRAVSEAVALGVLVPADDDTGEFIVPSPQELAVAAELHAAGVPLLALTEQLRELRTQVEHIAARFLDFTNEHVFLRCFGHTPTESEVAEATELVRRLRPLAQQTVDAELARAMRLLSVRALRERLRPATDDPPEHRDGPSDRPVLLPAATLAAVHALVGEENAAAFIAAAAEREAAARTMDRLAARAAPPPGGVPRAQAPGTPGRCTGTGGSSR